MAAKKKKAGKKKTRKRQARVEQEEQADIPEPSLAEILEHDDGVDGPGPPPDEIDEPDDGLDDPDSDAPAASDFDRDAAAQAARERGLSRMRDLQGEADLQGEVTSDAVGNEAAPETPEIEHRVTAGLPELPSDLERVNEDEMPTATLHLHGAIPVGQYGHSVQSSNQIDLRPNECREDSFGIYLELPQRNLLGQVVPGKPFCVRIPWSNVRGITDYMPRGGR